MIVNDLVSTYDRYFNYFFHRTTGRGFKVPAARQTTIVIKKEFTFINEKKKINFTMLKEQNVSTTTSFGQPERQPEVISWTYVKKFLL